MEKLPDKPDGCVISEAIDSDGITLRWWPIKAGLSHYAGAAFIAVMTCLVTGGCIAMATSYFRGGGGIGPGCCAAFVVFGGWAFFAVILIRHLWIMLRPDQPGLVRLQPQWLRYAPERSKVKAGKQDMPWPFHNSPPGAPHPRRAAVPRAQIHGVALERVCERQRLILDCRADRIEIGADLGAADREWLHAVLQRWLSPSGDAGFAVRETSDAQGIETSSAKPPGCAIEEQVDAEGVTLRWPPPAPGLKVYAVAGMYALFLGPLTLGLSITACSILFNPAGGLSGCFIFVWCLLAFVGACLVYGIWTLVRADRPESVRLEPERLRYEPGRSKAKSFQEWFESPRPKAGTPSPPAPRPVVVKRAEIRGFVLDRVGERQRLSFEFGNERVEIGAFLREPEREWLHAILRRWLSPGE